MEIMEGRGYGPIERIESCVSFRRGEGSLLSTAWSKKVAGDRSSTCRPSARWKESTPGLEKGRCRWRRLGIAWCEGVGALSQRNWMEGKRSTGIARGGELTTMAAGKARLWCKWKGEVGRLWRYGAGRGVGRLAHFL